MKNIALLVVALVGLVALAFFVGAKAGRYAFVKGWNLGPYVSAPVFWGKGGRGGMMMGRGWGGFHRGGPQGEIEKIEGNTVTLKLPNGDSYSVALSDEATVNKITKGTKEDLQVGQTISVLGGGFWDTGEVVFIQP